MSEPYCSLVADFATAVDEKTISENKSCKVSNCQSSENFLSEFNRDHCPLLIHGLLPYYFTFSHKGWFPWMKDRGTVVVQCPSTEGNIAVEVQSRKGKIIGEVIQGNHRCPYYGDKKPIDLSAMLEKTCYYKLASLLPLLSKKTLFQEKETIPTHCGYGNQPAEFQYQQVEGSNE